MNVTPQLRHAAARVDGVRLHWAELGAPTSRPPIVLLHGIGDAYVSWRPVAPELARDRLVLMPNLPGCGLSERPDASYRLEWEAQMIARWLEQLGLASVDVVGHSYGGGVAQMLLLACPTRTRRIVLVASGGLGRDLGFWLRFASFPKAVELWGQPFMAFGTRRALGSAARVAQDAADVAALAEMNALPGTARAFSRMVRDVITCLAAPVPGAVFRSFPEAGHYVHRDCAKELADATRQFLDDPNAEPARLRRADSRARRTAPPRALGLLSFLMGK